MRMNLWSKKREIQGGLTDLPGVKVGHYTDLEAGTGCTAVICPDGTVASVDVRGTAPGTREIALLDPVCAVQNVNAVLLSGGSAFGLAAADGVMRWLEEHKIGFNVGVARVPIVPAAILFDLGFGSATVRPTADNGYAACEAAHNGPIPHGNIGAGTGATVGKYLGFGQATKAGLGSASRHLPNGIIVAALVAVNAVGDVYDPSTGEIIAGTRKIGGGGFTNSQQFIESRLGQLTTRLTGSNTTLAVVGTNVALDKAGCQKVAQMAHDGLARTIRPIHTHMDGDTIFALSTGKKKADLSVVGAVAADVLAEAVITAVLSAQSLHGIPSASELAQQS